ncbi:MAG: hypothetical protein C0617_15255 [Desulfuromonas sp.]|uniref:GNAT family N-acetyltransferase n=1 Tax=Desulfuromonas sp. TaxID=892 RepID=UPI000CBA2BD8|nr:GNAT family N-acetyltransferase [Desulfuromonas sp.]PLX82015.1 MAG: hypothetical protein C0617_15255 [Desulfuromonas sp.]
MVRLGLIKYHQFCEHARKEGFGAALRFSFYKYEEAVPVEKSLAELKPLKKPPTDGLQLLDLGPEEFFESPIFYPLRSRRERAASYFRRGYRTVAMIRNGKVVGDLWYVSRDAARTPEIHPHVKWFGIDLGPDEVYMFDMHVVADERGEGLATYFMGSVLHHLQKRNVRKAYGYFAAHNTPALWVHRLVGFRELSRFTVRRFFLYETAKAKT